MGGMDIFWNSTMVLKSIPLTTYIPFPKCFFNKTKSTYVLFPLCSGCHGKGLLGWKPTIVDGSAYMYISLCDVNQGFIHNKSANERNYSTRWELKQKKYFYQTNFDLQGWRCLWQMVFLCHYFWITVTNCTGNDHYCEILGPVEQQFLWI